MISLIVAGYVVFVAAIVTLMLRPQWMTRWARATRALALECTGRVGAMFVFGGAVLAAADRHSADFAERLSANRRLVLSAALLVVLPPAAVFALRRPAPYSFADRPPAYDQQIAALLRGEQLVPPSPPPPEAFTTREVELVSPGIAHANRDWAQLNPDFTQRLLAVFKAMRERHGYDMVLLEGLRSPERQAELAAAGPNVTRAAAYMSYHQYGLAADCAFMREGAIVISEKDPWARHGYALYGETAEEFGLTWGGRWTMRDLGHVELRRQERLHSAGS